MSKPLILMAGYPATGKSYLTNMILKRHPNSFAVITPDDIKEQVWDEVGFNNADEKAALELEVWRRYYAGLEHCCAKGICLISDYPFSDKQKDRLAKLAASYDYRVLTIRLIGDPKILYKRSFARDMNPSRHLGHLVTQYHKGDVLEDRAHADDLVTIEIFLDRCANKGYDRFQLGDLIEVDATDVSTVDYSALLKQINTFIASCSDDE